MKYKISYLTYLYILLFLLSGLFKEITILIIIILFHELGHIILIKLLKYPIERIIIYPFGGSIIIDKPINSFIYEDVLIASGGIINQLLLLAITYIFSKYLDSDIYHLLIKYNLIIVIINIIPIYPLDGFKILNALLNYIASFYYAFLISIIINILTLILFLTFNNYVPLIMVYFTIFTLFYLLNNYHNYLNQFYLERLYYDFPYRKIKYLKIPNKKYLKREVKSYYQNKLRIMDEKAIITKKG